MTKTENVFNEHLKLITKYRNQADQLLEDNPQGLMQKIQWLARAITHIGRVSSILDGEYKRVYAERHRVYAQAEIDSPAPRKAHAELAVKDLRKQEAEAYENMQRWRNAFLSTTEELHSLKLRLRIDFADGNNEFTK
jgi:hypothetical protein